jgi:hypothetical protein
VTRPPASQRVAGWLVRRACRRLPDSIRDETCREWTAELPAITGDPDIRLAPVRAVRALGYAAGTFRGARRLRRMAGGAGRRPAGAAPGGWASSSQRPPVMPPLPAGVRLIAAALVLWLTMVFLIHLLPVAGSWLYLYLAGSAVCDALILTGIVRLARRARRRRRGEP